MKSEVEISQIDRKYEGHRLRSGAREKALLSQIAACGIDEPLSGVWRGEESRAVLLDGFKRLRCAEKLKLHVVPFVSLGEDEAQGILRIIRASQDQGLTILEQAAFVEELRKTHRLSVAEIASRLKRSKGWVQVRLTTFSEMSNPTRGEILSGRFPLYTYLYTLHPYRRLTGGASRREIDEFVGLTSGRGCSTRELERLAQAYFRGSENAREQMRKGDLAWCLERLPGGSAATAVTGTSFSEAERLALRDLEIIHACMGRLALKLGQPGLGSSAAFFAQAGVVAEGCLSRLERFSNALRGFHDRSRQAPGRLHSAQRGHDDPKNRPQSPALA
jgi:hypothetical protein